MYLTHSPAEFVPEPLEVTRIVTSNDLTHTFAESKLSSLTDGKGRSSAGFFKRFLIEQYAMNTIADELGKLHELFKSGALSQEEFDRVKNAILDAGVPDLSASANRSRPADVHLQLELLLIDEEWRMKQNRHGVFWGRYSAAKVPSLFGVIFSVCGSIIGCVFWIYLLTTAPAMDDPFVLRMLGLIFIVTGIALPIYHWIQYRNYKSAHDQYQRRRAEVLTKLERLSADSNDQEEYQIARF